jgi:nitrite reductase (NADH) large subunit
MQTNEPGLYAAGDVSESFNRLSLRQEWMGTWANACYQGRTAGMNMAGISTRFAGSIPQHVSPIFSWIYMQIGDALRVGPKVTNEENGDPFKGPYTITIFDDDVLVGANLINNPMDLAWIKKEINRGL